MVISYIVVQFKLATFWIFVTRIMIRFDRIGVQAKSKQAIIIADSLIQTGQTYGGLVNISTYGSPNMVPLKLLRNT